MDAEEPILLRVISYFFWVYAALLLTVWLGTSLFGELPIANKTYFMLMLPAMGLVVVQVVGSVLMFKLKRLGFYLFMAAWIAAFVLPFTRGETEIHWLTVVSAIFPICYGLSFKYLK